MKFIDSEHWVEFFGSFVPGLFFILFSSLCLFAPAFLFLSILLIGAPSSPAEFLSEIYYVISNLPSIGWIVLAILIFPISYFLGHIFHRQDPKIPNRKGYEKLKAGIEKKYDGDPNIRDILKRELCCVTSEECEYPYPYLRNYLEFRGLEHLCAFVAWSENPEYRSKNYINILKMRLQYHAPEKCRIIVKNEAHVRLATSMWYVAGALIGCAKVSLALVIASVVFAIAKRDVFAMSVHESEIWNMLVVSLFVASFICLFSRYVRMNVESFIHYQRQREIIHVLETAWIAFGESPERLQPPFRPRKPA